MFWQVLKAKVDLPSWKVIAQHSPCTPAMQRQLQSSRRAQQGPAQGAALGAEHTLHRKLLCDRTEPLSHDRSPLSSVLTKASPAGIILVGQLLSAPGILCHSPLPCHPPHTQHSQLCIYLFTVFQETLRLNEFIQDYLNLFSYISKQHSKNSSICEF